MSEQKSNRIEKFKTVLLVVLFLMTILLLYLLWSPETQSHFSLPDILSQREQVEIPEVGDMLLPDKVAYSYGDGSFALMENNLEEAFSLAVSQLKALNDTPERVVSEITEDQFREGMDQYKAAFVSIKYAIPFDEICLRYDIRDTAEFDGIEDVHAIAFSEADNQSIFIYDQNAKKYFRIFTGVKNSAIGDILELITHEKTTVYYKIGNILGGENDALIPLMPTSRLSSIYYKEESREASETVRKALAESLFGENFDFVRRITDNFGNVTYMYGYGQKIFTSYADGVLEYKNEVPQGTSGGFFEDLDVALSFVASHGTWNSLDGANLKFYLAQAQRISEEKKEGYSFSFGTLIMGEKLFYEQGYPIEVKVVNGQVSYYKRNVISIYNNQAFKEESAPVQDPANVIAQNYGYIYNVMTNNTLPVSEDAAFEYVANSVSSVEDGLARTENSNSLQPAWAINMKNGSSFYFSLYEASPIGLRK